MEFHEKLQELRKSRGLTQEELAEELYVSRTAISKWESGRGYPSIDSLKEISNYFSVTIDELLSTDKLLSIAEKENRANLRGMCDLLFGLLDVFNCFTALSKCGGWICLFSKSICIHSDYIIEPFIVLDYDCFSCRDWIYKIDTDKIRYTKI